MLLTPRGNNSHLGSDKREQKSNPAGSIKGSSYGAAGPPTELAGGLPGAADFISNKIISIQTDVQAKIPKLIFPEQNITAHPDPTDPVGLSRAGNEECLGGGRSPSVRETGGRVISCFAKC